MSKCLPEKICSVWNGGLLMVQFFYDLLHDKETFEKHIGNMGLALVLIGWILMIILVFVIIIIKS